MTAQIHEKLIYNGEETSMAFCPPLPEGHPRVMEIDPHSADYRDEDRILHSTACWRGYQGAWQIRDERFYLTGLRGRFRLVGEEPLLADWFSGVLRIPRGELLHYVHMGFGSVYEGEVHVKIEQGVVTATRTIDNRGVDFDRQNLGWQNLPGGENRFPGDDEM
jgi:hypothetical protein